MLLLSNQTGRLKGTISEPPTIRHRFSVAICFDLFWQLWLFIAWLRLAGLGRRWNRDRSIERAAAKEHWPEKPGSWSVRGRRRRNVKFNPVGRVGLFRACGIQIGDLVFAGRVFIEDPERLAGESVTLR